MKNKTKGVIWNTLGSVMFALNSMLLTLIVSRFEEIYVAGEFGIAFTTAQILYIVGLFGINIYQMTDYEFKYSFKTYFSAKIISTILMIIISIFFILLYCKSSSKIIFTILLTIYMGIYSFAEVYQSFYFQHNRLDLSGKSLFYRTFFSIICFYIALKLKISINIALIILIGVNLISYYFVTYKPLRHMTDKISNTSTNKLKGLLIETTPVFFSLLTMNILTNISKYAVDWLKGSELQGYYNVIFMPVMVINLLSSFIFKPMLNDYSTYLSNNEYQMFKSLLVKHLTSICMFVIVTLLGTYLIGTQVLSYVYNIDITSYIIELLIIIVAGGFLAVGSLMYYILIIMRRQKAVLINFIICVVVEIVLVVMMVPKFNILGATLSLACAQVLLVFNYITMLYRYLGGEKKCLK